MATRKKIPLINESASLDVTGDITITGSGSATITFPSSDATLLSNLSELNDLSDITITSPSDNEVLAYDSTSGDWINQTASEAGLGTVTSVSAGDGMNFTTITSSGDITLGTPSTLTNATTNSATGTTHTHELDLSGYNYITTSSVTYETLNTNGDVGTTASTLAAGDDSRFHDAVTVTDSSEIDFTLTGQQITASLIAGSIDESKLDTSVNASLDLADSALQSGDDIEFGQLDFEERTEPSTPSANSTVHYLRVSGDYQIQAIKNEDGEEIIISSLDVSV